MEYSFIGWHRNAWPPSDLSSLISHLSSFIRFALPNRAPARIISEWHLLRYATSPGLSRPAGLGRRQSHD